MNDGDVDIEKEKTKSWKLGHISMLEDLSDELRERAGETWAESSSRTETEIAKELKTLANEFENRASKRREQLEGNEQRVDGR